MAVFAAIAPELDPRLEEAVKREFEGRFYKVAPTQFLISSHRITTNQVAEKLGASGGHVGRVLIARLVNYTGWHSRDMSEWIAAQNVPPAPPAHPAGHTEDAPDE